MQLMNTFALISYRLTHQHEITLQIKNKNMNIKKVYLNMFKAFAPTNRIIKYKNTFKSFNYPKTSIYQRILLG